MAENNNNGKLGVYYTCFPLHSEKRHHKNGHVFKEKRFLFFFFLSIIIIFVWVCVNEWARQRASK